MKILICVLILIFLIGSVIGSQKPIKFEYITFPIQDVEKINRYLDLLNEKYEGYKVTDTEMVLAGGVTAVFLITLEK